MRRLGCIVTAGLALAAVVGCGSSDPKPVPTAYTSIARSRAHAVAPLLTIRAADLPEFKVTAHAAGAQEGLEDHRYRKCVHASSPLRPWANAKSERLSANSGYHLLGASSSVSVMPTPGAARLEVAQTQNANRTCVEHVLRAELAKQHLRLPVRGVVVEPYSASVKGADASVAYQIVIAYRRAPLVAYVDLIVFSYGQDAMTLTTYHASKPVPPAMEERLLGLLVARARSHSR